MVFPLLNPEPGLFARCLRRIARRAALFANAQMRSASCSRFTSAMGSVFRFMITKRRPLLQTCQISSGFMVVRSFSKLQAATVSGTGDSCGAGNCSTSPSAASDGVPTRSFEWAISVVTRSPTAACSARWASAS